MLKTQVATEPAGRHSIDSPGSKLWVASDNQHVIGVTEQTIVERSYSELKPNEWYSEEYRNEFALGAGPNFEDLCPELHEFSKNLKSHELDEVRTRLHDKRLADLTAKQSLFGLELSREFLIGPFGVMLLICIQAYLVLQINLFLHHFPKQDFTVLENPWFLLHASNRAINLAIALAFSPFLLVLVCCVKYDAGIPQFSNETAHNSIWQYSIGLLLIAALAALSVAQSRFMWEIHRKWARISSCSTL